MLLCMSDVHVSCACAVQHQVSRSSAQTSFSLGVLFGSEGSISVQNKATHVEVFSLKLSEFFLSSPSLPDAVFYRNIYKPIHHSDAVCSGGPDQPSNQVDGCSNA
ncbi:hypothetical protein ATANTOWER_027773 [Ataeniobius toweri]|uniref:Uncharacterized protein n=1 Tax=Ataeniobius toweri TaxID=208326 RepID=A0ABU7ADL5_9TELE|nr:hypothetical protein [Ataeniobius toweri]